MHTFLRPKACVPRAVSPATMILASVYREVLLASVVEREHLPICYFILVPTSGTLVGIA